MNEIKLIDLEFRKEYVNKAGDSCWVEGIKETIDSEGIRVKVICSCVESTHWYTYGLIPDDNELSIKND